LLRGEREGEGKGGGCAHGCAPEELRHCKGSSSRTGIRIPSGPETGVSSELGKGLMFRLREGEGERAQGAYDRLDTMGASPWSFALCPLNLSPEPSPLPGGAFPSPALLLAHPACVHAHAVRV